MPKSRRLLSHETAVFVSEPVAFTAEVRTFLLDGIVLDAGVYEGASQVTGAIEFVGALAQSMPLPRAVVGDVGLIDGRGWAVVEFNAAWGAGLSGCDAEKVVPAIISATGTPVLEGWIVRTGPVSEPGPLSQEGSFAYAIYRVVL